MRRMISLSPSSDAEAWSAWLDHYRGTKNELKMLSCARQGRAFKVWTRLPASRPVSAGLSPHQQQHPTPAALVKVERPIVHGAELDAIAERVEKAAELAAEEATEEAQRVKTATRADTARERGLRKVQMGDRPSIDKLPDLGTIEIFDPTEEQELRDGHRKVTTLKTRVKIVNLRDDPVGTMAKRDQITPVQLEAARKWQAWHDAAQLGSIRGIDPSNVAVDGGRFSEPDLTVQRFAIKQLVRADLKLGEVGAMLVRRVLGDRMTVAQVAAIIGNTSERGVRSLGWRLRECLDTLVSATGAVMEGPKPSTPRDAHAELAQYAGGAELHAAVRAAKPGNQITPVTIMRQGKSRGR